MINNWMLSRPNRKLIPIIDTLSVFSLLTLGESWTTDVQRQLNFELELREQVLSDLVHEEIRELAALVPMKAG